MALRTVPMHEAVSMPSASRHSLNSLVRQRTQTSSKPFFDDAKSQPNSALLVLCDALERHRWLHFQSQLKPSPRGVMLIMCSPLCGCIRSRPSGLPTLRPAQASRRRRAVGCINHCDGI